MLFLCTPISPPPPLPSIPPPFLCSGHVAAPFQANPVKGAYMMRDAERAAARHGLPFNIPADFPHNTVLATRVACAFQDAPWVADFIARIYTAEFVEGLNVGDEAVVAAAVAGAGQDPAAVLAAATAPAAKDRLRAQTEEALRLGIFGAPTLVVGGGGDGGAPPELFWGQDRVADAIDWACGRHPMQLRLEGSGQAASPRL